MNFFPSGKDLPAYFASSGFSSNVSTWLGPPFIIRKMTLLTFDGKWDGRGLSGLADRVGLAARAWREKKPSPSRSDVSASPANPAPISQTNSRRVWPQGKK